MGQSMVEPDKVGEPRDLRAVGWLMVAMMEPGTNAADDKSIDLQSPDIWQSGTLTFLKKTASKSLSVLEKVCSSRQATFGVTKRFQDPFLDLSSGTRCLIPHIWITEKTSRSMWEFTILMRNPNIKRPNSKCIPVVSESCCDRPTDHGSKRSSK